MKILIIPDSFKESLSAIKVAESMERGIRKTSSDIEIIKIPISDGGDGFLDCVLSPIKGKRIDVKVKDPLLRDIIAQYGIIENGKTAVIEMALASGLELLNSAERNPMVTSTYGTGQLIEDALNKGCTKIMIGLGGSATNDGGIGMIEALGGKFLDATGKPIDDGGVGISNLKYINLDALDKRIVQCEIVGVCDVTNPLVGKHGASYVFGSQKGGSKTELKQLDQNLTQLKKISKHELNIDLDLQAGAGAAGGTGAAILGFLNGKLEIGIDFVIDVLGIEKEIKNADLIFTGEGKIDQQTFHGKTVFGVAQLAKKHNTPLIAIVGAVDGTFKYTDNIGITAVFSIINQPMALKDALQNADRLIENCIENVMRVYSVRESSKNKHS